MGAGVFTLAASAAAAKPALQAAEKAGVAVEEISNNPAKNILNCVKSTPDALKVSKGNIVTNLTGTIQADSTLLRTNVHETYSKAADTEVYRFNPNGTPEEVLANNPNVSYEAKSGKYYVQTSWGEKAYIDSSQEYLIAKYGEGDYNAIAGDVFQETYVDANSYHADSSRNYINPSELEYGKTITATKQAPAKFVVAENGTQYQSLEGVHTLDENSVIMIDSKGNPYQNTLANLVKRNELTNEEILNVCREYANANKGVNGDLLYEELTGLSSPARESVEQSAWLANHNYIPDYQAWDSAAQKGLIEDEKIIEVLERETNLSYEEFMEKYTNN